LALVPFCTAAAVDRVQLCCIAMVGCSKCRHAAKGCAMCNPKRFSLRSRCMRKAGCYDECGQAFKTWLMSEHGLAESSASAYASVFKRFLKHNGSFASIPDTLQTTFNAARPKMEQFVKLPEFVHAGASQIGSSKKSSPASKGPQKHAVMKKSKMKLKRSAAGPQVASKAVAAAGIKSKNGTSSALPESTKTKAPPAPKPEVTAVSEVQHVGSETHTESNKMKVFPSSSPAPRQRDAGKAAVQTPQQPEAGAFSAAPAQVRAVHPASQPQQRAVPPSSLPQQRHQSASSSGPPGLVQVPVPLRRPPATPQACGSTSELECLVKACALGKDEALVRSALGLSPIAQDSASLPHPAPAKAAMSDKKAQVVSTAGKLSTKMITGAKSRVLSMRAAAANPDKQHQEPKSSKEKVPSAKAHVPSQMQKRTITPSARGVPAADSKRHKHVQQSQVPVETPSELVPKEPLQAPLEDDIPIAEYLETSFEDMLEDSTVVKKASLARAPRTRAKQIGATPKIRGQR